MASRFTSRLRRFSRLSCLVVFAAIGLSSALRSLAAEFEFFAARTAGDSGQAVVHLHRAATLWPYDYQMRTATAYYWTATRFYPARDIAIPDIKEALVANSYAADLWLALATYASETGDSTTAGDAMSHVHALRKGMLTREQVYGLERY